MSCLQAARRSTGCALQLEPSGCARSCSVLSLARRHPSVLQGYVDDPRNTDNAWMETTAFHFHCTEALARRMPLRAGTDAGDVMWLDVDANDPKFANLYASHREWVEDVAATFNQNLVEVIKRKVVANLRPIFGCGGWWAWPLSLGVAAACLAVWRGHLAWT